MSRTPREVILAATVLLNLLRAGREDLLGALSHLRFLIADEVAGDVAGTTHERALRQAIQAGAVQQVSLATPAALKLYSELWGRLQAGEAASLALAAATGAFIAADDQRLFLREALARLGQHRILNTPGLLLLATRRGVLTVAEADAIKAHLETFRFKMAFRSFRDLEHAQGCRG